MLKAELTRLANELVVAAEEKKERNKGDYCQVIWKLLD